MLFRICTRTCFSEYVLGGESRMIHYRWYSGTRYIGALKCYWHNLIWKESQFLSITKVGSCYSRQSLDLTKSNSETLGEHNFCIIVKNWEVWNAFWREIKFRQYTIQFWTHFWIYIVCKLFLGSLKWDHLSVVKFKCRGN